MQLYIAHYWMQALNATRVSSTVSQRHTYGRDVIIGSPIVHYCAQVCLGTTYIHKYQKHTIYLLGERYTPFRFKEKSFSISERFTTSHMLGTLFLLRFFSILHAQRVKVFQRSKKYIRRSCDHFSKQMLLIRKQCYPRKYSQIGCDCETRYAYTSLTKRCLSIHVSFV